MKINIESVYDVLEFIREKLRKLCGESLYLEFDFFDKMTSNKPLEKFDLYDIEANTLLMLCLFHNKKCISSITCKVDESTIEISSKTNENYQGKKYNLFLRSALVLIIANLEYMDDKGENKTFNKIISRAVNPISILAMAKHFYGSNEKFHEYMTKHGLNYDTITLENTNRFYDELTDIPSDIEDEDEKIDYYEKFIEPYDPVVLEINLEDEKTIAKTLHNIENIHILCPEMTKSSKTSTKSSKKPKKPHKPKKPRQKNKTKKK